MESSNPKGFKQLKAEIRLTFKEVNKLMVSVARQDITALSPFHDEVIIYSLILLFL